MAKEMSGILLSHEATHVRDRKIQGMFGLQIPRQQANKTSFLHSGLLSQDFASFSASSSPAEELETREALGQAFLDHLVALSDDGRAAKRLSNPSGMRRSWRAGCAATLWLSFFSHPIPAKTIQLQP